MIFFFIAGKASSTTTSRPSFSSSKSDESDDGDSAEDCEAEEKPSSGPGSASTSVLLASSIASAFPGLS